MSPELPKPPEETALVIQRPAGLLKLPQGESPALAEIINRSLAHLGTSQSPAMYHRQPGEEREFEIAPGVIMRMCWIPPGEFLMGSLEGELGRFGAEIQHRVTITQGFWMGKYEVTQAQWEAVMGGNPSHFKRADLPVEKVSWNDISEPGGFLEKVNSFAAVGGRFSLPTEAQWEYSCRAGTTSALNNGKELTSTEGACRNLDEVAWYEENSNGETHSGGLKRANFWGLHDMHGNLWEWCADWFGDYPTEAVIDPRGPDSGSFRLVRGGSWYRSAYYCRAALRGGNIIPGNSGSNVGFRIARSSVP